MKQHNPVWLDKAHHEAVRTIALLTKTSMQNIVQKAIDDYAITLTGKHKEIYDRAAAGEPFDRRELKFLGRMALLPKKD